MGNECVSINPETNALAGARSFGRSNFHGGLSSELRQISAETPCGKSCGRFRKNPKKSNGFKVQWRSGRDSNPRYGFAVYSLSRRAPSTTRPPLRMNPWKALCPRGFGACAQDGVNVACDEVSSIACPSGACHSVVYVDFAFCASRAGRSGCPCHAGADSGSLAGAGRGGGRAIGRCGLASDPR